MSCRTIAPNAVTLAHLHAALDRLDALESLFGDILVPVEASTRARRLGMLAGEIRDIIVDLLRPDAAPDGARFRERMQP